MDLNSLSSIPPAELGAVAVDLSSDAFQEYMWFCGRQTGSQDGSANRAEMTVSLSLPISYSGWVGGGVAMPSLHSSPAIIGAVIFSVTQNVLFMIHLW